MQQTWDLVGPWMQQPWSVLQKGVTGVRGVLDKEKEMASTIMESLFQRTLEDLIKGLRVQIIGEAAYVAKVLEEIKKEIKSTDGHTKAVALQKLTYLNMLRGVDMEWASFYVVEVMSSSRFVLKQIGYLAATQSFHEGTDVLLLITNQLRKDLISMNEYEAGLALDCLSRIATPDLARDLMPEVFTMLNSTRLYVRKKATLVLMKLFSKYPDGVRIAFKRLVEKLDDPDPQVVCAAVNVLCELAIKDPQAYLPLAPEFYRLLVDSTNNWLLIKIVKIFGVLSPIEPRLGRKIAEPICEHIRRTGAKSLLFECIRMVAVGLDEHIGAVKLAAEKLKELLAEDDPNVKYLALDVLATLMLHHPWVVLENKEVIVRSLNDGDPSIQMASLRLIMGMVSENNVIEIVQILMQYVQKSDPDFSNELIGTILATCSRRLYEFVTDFSWYVSVLGDIARIPHCSHGKEVERQLIDIGIRVEDARLDLVGVARSLLLDPTLLGHSSIHNVLSAAAWIAGEYVKFSENPNEIIEALLQPRTKLLPSSVQAVYLQAVFKVFVFFVFESLKNTENSHVLSLPKNTTDPPFGLSLMEEPKSASLAQHEGAAGILDDNREEVIIREASINPLEMFSQTSFSNDIPESVMKKNAECPFNALSQEKGHKLDEKCFQLMELITTNVKPLAQSVDVEVQERACNILGFLKVFKGQVSDSTDSSNKDVSGTVFQLFQFMRGIFSQELGPVSVHAQGRIPVPEGLNIEEALESLNSCFTDEDTLIEKDQELNSFKSQIPEWENGPVFVEGKKEDAFQSGESTSLLALHRQRHNAFYLPTEKTSAKEYPPPHIPDPGGASTSGGALNEIVKLAEQSLVSTKTRRSKPRPVVIRLDDTEEMPISAIKSNKDLKDDLISNAIREVLTVDRSKPLHTKGIEDNQKMLHGTDYQHAKKSHRSKQPQGQVSKEKTSALQVDSQPSLKSQSTPVSTCSTPQTTGAEFVMHETRQSHHSRHRKVQEGKHPELGSGSREKKRQSRQRSKHKTRSPVQISLQTPVIPDFLL